MLDDLDKAPDIVKPSKYWIALNTRNLADIERHGVENFKRTVVKNYFTWMQIWPWDPQIRFLLGNLTPWSIVSAIAGTVIPPKHQHIPLLEGVALKFLTRLIWAYAKSEAPAELESVEEPAIGNPPDIKSGGRLISQDLANSILEYRSIREASAFGPIATVCELGGGYGRNAYAYMSLAAPDRYIMVDIPPALTIAQTYSG
ncbi:MAG: putative sugar O-methyltransferase [Alphaproteobacteria bacterium]